MGVGGDRDKATLVTPQAIAPPRQLRKMKQKESLLPKTQTAEPWPPLEGDQGRSSRNAVQREGKKERGERGRERGERTEQKRKEGDGHKRAHRVVRG